MTNYTPAQEDYNKEIEGFKASCKKSCRCCCRHFAGSWSKEDIVALGIAYLGTIVMTVYFIGGCH